MPRGARPAGATSQRLAAILREEVARQGITQTRLKDMTGISQSQISIILRAVRPADVDQLQAICDALGLDISDTVRKAEGAG